MTDEEREFFRRAEDLCERCRRSGNVTTTGYLTPAEQYALRPRVEAREVQSLFTGGVEGCERQCCFFLPDWMEADAFDGQEYIHAVRLKSYFGEPGHRDYMGAILGLGIRRKWLGDIRVTGDICTVFCLPSVEPVLLDLDKVGRYTVKAASLPLSEVPAPERKVKTVSFTVKSLRLDAVAGEMFSVSRSVAADAIRMGLVQLNYSPCLRTDAAVKEGDVLSFRGKGKGTVAEVGGQSKKDRTFVTAEVWV